MARVSLGDPSEGGDSADLSSWLGAYALEAGLGVTRLLRVP